MKDRDKFVKKCKKKAKRHPKLAGAYFLYIGKSYSRCMNNKGLRNDSIAIDYFYKSIALTPEKDSIDKGYALYNLALMYFKNGEMQNFDSAYYYFEKSTHYADRFYVALGDMYQYGIGVETDPEYAFECYKRAVYGGSDAYTCLYAIDYFLEKAAEGQLDTVAFRQYQEAVLLQILGEDQNIQINNPEQYKRWKELLLASAEAGYVPAMFEYGSNSWLLKAIEKDYVPAIYSYAYNTEMKNGSWLVAGKEIYTRNQADAFPYYLQSAYAGYPPGQCAVGVYYFYGSGGIERDLAKAKYWYQLSADQGYPRAKKLLAEFDKEVAKIEAANLKASLDELAQSIQSLNQTVSQSFEKSQHMTPAQREAIQRNGYSRVSGKTLTQNEKKEHKTGQEYAWKHTDEIAYEGYEKLLSDMNFGFSYYSESNRLDYQRSMAEIRTRWEKKGYYFHKSHWETWDGHCDYYKK